MFLLPVFQDRGITPDVGHHPRGTQVGLDWDTFPACVHPKEGRQNGFAADVSVSILYRFCVSYWLTGCKTPSYLLFYVFSIKKKSFVFY